MKKYCLLFLSVLFIYQNVSAQKTDEKQYQQLEKTIDRYQRLKNRTEWPKIVLSDKPVLKLNDTSKIIPAIKQRLELLGDLRRGRDKDIYTPRMEIGVKQFQLRHGLDDDGVIGPAFMKALNMPLDKRIEQMKVNMTRISQDTINMAGTRIIANIPEYRLRVYEDNKEVLTMDIVVGKITNPTIVFSDSLEHVVFSPYWNVPPSIVKNEILPQMSKSSSYLKKNNMEITGKEDGLPTIRQKPGRDNSLGGVKFLFPNKYNIYFHDTPAKTLFERKNRAFSHGCIRLSQPLELAKYLLKDQPEWSGESMKKAMNSTTEKWVKLNNPVPVSIIYYTAWVDSSGLVNFRDDIYGHDQEQLNFQ